jgi:hypothetical protein
MEHKDNYTMEEITELWEELYDLGVDIDELPDETTILDCVKMSNRLRS